MFMSLFLLSWINFIYELFFSSSNLTYKTYTVTKTRKIIQNITTVFQRRPFKAPMSQGIETEERESSVFCCRYSADSNFIFWLLNVVPVFVVSGLFCDTWQ